MLRKCIFGLLINVEIVEMFVGRTVLEATVEVFCKIGSPLASDKSWKVS